MTDERHLPGHQEEQAPESGFETDPDTPTGIAEPETGVLEHEPAHATVLTEAAVPDLSVLDVRPAPSEPREYRFPAFERVRLDNGLEVISCHMAGRPLLAASLVVPGGGALEPADLAGVTVLMGRALTEGTRRRGAIDFIEAGERLGAELHADATWDAMLATLEVPRSRFGPALALLAEMFLQPAFPGTEVERLREERLNDLLQARADPRRRVERLLSETIFDPGVPYSRPLAGMEQTVELLDRDTVLQRHQTLLASAGATLVVAGDLTGLDVPALADEHFTEWTVAGGDVPPPSSAAHPAGARLVLADKPGAPQSQLRIGHRGLARRTPDFHAVSVMNMILGSMSRPDARLNRLLREERGYTYGAGSSFEMRRAAGPFVVRTAVETGSTVAAISDTLTELRRIREAEVEQRELDAARDYLVGVFPLRFEVPAQVCSALAGLVVQELPDDELDRYRPAIATVSAADVLAAARHHIRPDEASIVVVGDAATLEAPLRDAGLAPLEIVSDAAVEVSPESGPGG